MFFGIILIIAGALLTWMVSGILGGIAVVAGVIKIAFHFLNVEPEIEIRRYDGGPKTYDLRSSKVRS